MQKMRANVREKMDVVNRIEQLLKLLQSNAEDISKELEHIGADERQQVQEKMKHSMILKRRVDGFIRYVVFKVPTPSQ